MDLSEILQLPRPELEKLPKSTIVNVILSEQRIDASLPIEQDEWGNPVYQLQRTLRGDGSLVEQTEVRWTYHEPACEGRVDRITVDRGIGKKERMVVPHSREGKVGKIQKSIIAEPIKEPEDARPTR